MNTYVFENGNGAAVIVMAADHPEACDLGERWCELNGLNWNDFVFTGGMPSSYLGVIYGRKK